MTRKGKNKNKKPNEQHQPPKQKEEKKQAASPVKTPTNDSKKANGSLKYEENNNPNMVEQDPPKVDDDGEEAEWCEHLDNSDPKEFVNLFRKPLNCITCLRKAHFSCIHKDCMKKAVSNCCGNLKHLFPHISQKNHPAFLHHKLQVILCTRCNIRSSLGHYLKHFNVPTDFLTQPIPKGPKPLKQKGLLGYVNFGNTCYMNAVLQLLGHCPSFAEYLIRFVPPGGWEVCSPDIPKTVVQMALDLRGIHSSVKLPFSSPWKIISCVRNELPGFECFQQQDASEFLRNLLDILDRDLKACSEYYNNNNTPIGLGNPEDDYDIAMEAKTTKTAVSALFHGVLENQIKCHSCGFCSKTTENFVDMSIPIVSESEYEEMFSKPIASEKPKVDAAFTTPSTSYEDGADPGFLVNQGVTHKTSLNECLDMFFQNSVLHEDNQYSCRRCEKLVDATKSTKALHLPEYILIQLKRFRHTMYGSCKIGKTVEFPLRAQNFGRWTTSGKDAFYELVGFVVHEGRSVEYGHYVTFCKHELDSQWYKFDDVTVTRYDITQVAKAEPYIMMFRKMSDDSVMKQKRDSPFNFFRTKRLLTDKKCEAWDVIEKHLENVPEKGSKEKKLKAIPSSNVKSTRRKKAKKKRLSIERRNLILARSEIPLNKIKKHISNLERILEEIQEARKMKSKSRNKNRASRNASLEAVNMLIASLEKWFKVIIRKEWMAQNAGKTGTPSKKKNTLKSELEDTSIKENQKDP